MELARRSKWLSKSKFSALDVSRLVKSFEQRRLPLCNEIFLHRPDFEKSLSEVRWDSIRLTLVDMNTENFQVSPNGGELCKYSANPAVRYSLVVHFTQLTQRRFLETSGKNFVRFAERRLNYIPLEIATAYLRLNNSSEFSTKLNNFAKIKGATRVYTERKLATLRFNVNKFIGERVRWSELIN